MCGRITTKVSQQEIQELFNVVRGANSVDWTPRYNVAPTTIVMCIRETGEGRELFPAKWGLIPSWAKDTKLAASCINARADTVATKPMFRSAFKNRRCLVVASGFFEWRKIDAKNKQPHYITLASGEPMPMAGLWEQWTNPEGEKVESCTICTVGANTMMARLHDRMPVILPHAMISPWLDPEIKDVDALQPILDQYPPDDMQDWEVSKDVGNVRNQGEYLIEPVTAA